MGHPVDAHDPSALPPDLPVPVDDGGADHLVGMQVPALGFPATTGGEQDLVELAAGTLVLFVYPRTGVPGMPPPDGWDAIPGARGCTPQACAFRDHHAELAALGATVAGLSVQTPREQKEAAKRLHLPFPLLADPARRLGSALSLPTFDGGGATLYRRLTLVARAGRIVTSFYPVFPPDANANDVVAWLSGPGGADPPG
jgi:peroxiredoxin